MRIGEVAQIVGISARSIRHYHRLGVMPEPERTSGGYRDYDLADLARIARIAFLSDSGVPLREVSAILESERSAGGGGGAGRVMGRGGARRLVLAGRLLPVLAGGPGRVLAGGLRGCGLGRGAHGGERNGGPVAGRGAPCTRAARSGTEPVSRAPRRAAWPASRARGCPQRSTRVPSAEHAGAVSAR